MSAKTTYTELIRRSKELAVFGSTMSVLGWDQRVNLPPKGSKHRADQMTLLSGMAHKMSTDPAFGRLISECEASDLTKNADSTEAVNIRELRRDFDHATKLPQEFVEEYTKVRALAYDAWVEARKKNDFNAFCPHLEKVVALSRKKAEYLGYKKSKYDALLDQYEPGGTVEMVRAVFSPLQKELAELVGKIQSSSKRPNPKILENDYPPAAQEAFCKEAAKKIGFDFEAGRLDTTVHPFCSGMGPGDTRLTTRYDPNYFNDAFFGTLHEAGHGIYDQGLLEDNFGTPMGEAASLGVHESQSRMWENLVGRSKAFWKYFFPVAQKYFPNALYSVSLDEFYFAINESRPSFIRVEADEATYNLHIVLRFEIEVALMEGSLEAKDIPAVWNEQFKKLLGLQVPDAANGCLQDVHWSEGLMGYFPTYALGNLLASQFFIQAEKDLGKLDMHFERGEFTGLREWLRTNVHVHGRRYRTSELCKKVANTTLSHQPFMQYLGGKLIPLYGLA